MGTPGRCSFLTVWLFVGTLDPLGVQMEARTAKITKMAPLGSQKEYSGPPGSQNDSNMEPKMEPRQQRPTLTKHAQAWTDCMSPPLGELHLSSFLKDPKHITTKIPKKTKQCSKMTPKGLDLGLLWFGFLGYFLSCLGILAPFGHPSPNKSENYQK